MPFPQGGPHALRREASWSQLRQLHPARNGLVVGRPACRVAVRWFLAAPGSAPRALATQQLYFWAPRLIAARRSARGTPDMASTTPRFLYCSRFLLASALVWASCGPPASVPVPDGGLGMDPFQQALDSLNALIVKNPGRASLYDGRASLFLAVDSFAEAQRDLEWAVKLDSMQVNYHLRLGDLYYRTTQVAKAKDQFERASKVAPENTSALLKQAEIQLVLRNYAQSMELVNEALRADQHAAHRYFLKGWIHMETGDTALALSSFRTAVEQDAQDYPAYIMLGKISAAKRDPLAAQYYSTAIALRPSSVEAWYNKGIFHQENGQDSLALVCYDRIKELDPLNALAWYNSGYVRMEHLDDPAVAKEDFSEAIRLEPGYADAWYNRGLALERTSQLDSAASDYQRAMALRPDHSLAAEGLSRLQARGVN